MLGSAIAQIANSASGALGLAGSIDANALQQLTKGKIFNPYTEQLFSNMTFRSHQFSFKLFARDPDEAEEINKIVRYFKQGATPILNKDPNKFMEVPDKFDIKFVRMDPTMKTFRNSNEMHFKMFSSVCNGISGTIPQMVNIMHLRKLLWVQQDLFRFLQYHLHFLS